MKNRYDVAGPARRLFWLLLVSLCWFGVVTPLDAATPKQADPGSDPLIAAEPTAGPDHGSAKAEPTPSTSPAENTEDEEDWVRHVAESYQDYARQQEKTLAAVEQVREDAATAAAAATRTASAVDKRLARIEAVLSSDRERQVEALKESHQFTLTMLGVLGGLGLLGLVIFGIVMFRAMNRRVEAVSDHLVSHGLPALPGVGGEVARPTPAEVSSTRFLEAVERLEQRITGMEQGTPTSQAPRGDSGSRLTEPPSPVSLPAANRTGVAETSSASELLVEGQAHLNNEHLDEAMACFQRVLAIEPDNAEAHLKLGSVLEGRNRTDEAIEHYDRAIDLDRSMTMAYLRKGGVFNRLERYGEALECYEAALRTQRTSELITAESSPDRDAD